MVGVSRNSPVPLQRFLRCVVTDLLYPKVTIDALPGDVLLEIFSFYLDLDDAHLDAWHTLVHVCQQWRRIVFASPRYLNLRLRCTNRTPVRKMLDIWPTLPIVVFCHTSPSSPLRGVLNVAAALKCYDRVCEINIWDIPKSLFNRLARIKVPLPALTSLQLSSADDDRQQSNLPDSFLGGSAPHLRSLDLHGISFPAPQKLLLSATDLVTLRIERIPDFYLSPEEMVACLSTLTKLEEFALGFQIDLYLYHWGQITEHPPPAVLPSLTSFRFRGACEYLEDLISRTSLPRLDNVDISFYDLDTSDSPLLSQFVSNIKSLEAFDCADIAFCNQFVNITLRRSRGSADRRTLKFGICDGLDEQFSFLSQLGNIVLPPFPNLEHLYIHSSFPLPPWQYYAESTEWLELLHPFTSVKNLHLSENAALCVGCVLQDLSASGDSNRVTELLPALQNIFLPRSQPSGAMLEAIGQFITVLGLFDHFVSLHY